ncbi:MAG TPA: hypothetical protein PKA38_04990 [Candidatus Levybacteria bacterium]|nr:hypothetical protein [Candidatus Levybacteria bacterium]
MQKNLGEEISKGIKLLKSRNVKVLENGTEDRIFSVDSEKYRFTITLNPNRWIGLEFDLLDSDKKSLLNFTIDTDIYPISDSKYNSFASGIEKNIGEFLNALANRRIKIGRIKEKPAMIIPQDDGYLLIKKIWIFTTKKLYMELSKIESKGKFYPLLPQ